MTQPTTVKEVLQAIDDKFSDESKWNKGWYAMNEHGHKVSESSQEAISWCLVGGIIAVSPDESYSNLASDVAEQTFHMLRSMLPVGTSSLSGWNDADERTFQDVKDLIAKAKAQ